MSKILNNLFVSGNTSFGSNVGIKVLNPLYSLDVSGSANVSSGIFVGGDATIGGLIQHNGIMPTTGTNIDQILSITKSLTLATDWQDVGINGTDLATGTYVIQLYANDVVVGGQNNNEVYSGTMSWYSGSTSSSDELPTDEIVLHRAGGGSGNSSNLYLRTYRSTLPNMLKLQMYSNTALPSSSNYVFKFRRMI